MFLFRMHSVGSVRPKASAANALIRWWNNGNEMAEATSEAAVSEAATSEAATSEAAVSALNQANQDPNEIEEDVVVIQEEEMVLVRKEVQEEPEPGPVQEEPHPKCIEPASTVSVPSKHKNKKKQKRK